MKPIFFSFQLVKDQGRLGANLQLQNKKINCKSQRQIAPDNDTLLLESEERVINTTVNTLLGIFSKQLNDRHFDIDQMKTVILTNFDHAPTMLNILELFLQDKTEMVKNGTYAQKSYILLEYHINLFTNFLRQMHSEALAADDLTQRHLEDFYLLLILDKKLKRNTAMSAANNIVMIMNHSVKFHRIHEHRVAWIHRPRLPSDIEYLNARELAIFENYQPALINHRLVQCFFIIMTRTGLDFKTMQGLKKDALHKTYLRVDRPGRTSVKIPVSAETYRLIVKTSADHGTSLFVPMTTKIFGLHLIRLCKAMQLAKNLCSTSARLTFAFSKVLPAGVSIDTLSAVMGHSRISYTAQHFHYRDIKTNREMQNVKKQFHDSN